MNLQLEFFHSRHNPNSKSPPHVKWQGWKKKVVIALVTFTLRPWIDRNQVVHGHSIDHSKRSLTAHVHTAVHLEYRTFSRELEDSMAHDFSTPLRDKLRSSIKSRRYWLKRIGEGRTRQALEQDAKTKISTLRNNHHFVDTEKVLWMSNLALRQWLQRKVELCLSTQSTLERFLTKKTGLNTVFFFFSFFIVISALLGVVFPVPTSIGVMAPAFAGRSKVSTAY